MSRKKPGTPVCGAKNRRGEPCQCAPLPGRTRCKYHGGASTGPRSPEGKAKARANLAKAREALARPEHAATRSHRNAKGNRARPWKWLERFREQRGSEQNPTGSP
jgi:hypothetical protein